MNRVGRLVLVAACLAAGMAQGEPAIKDRSVLGWWRYNGGAAVDRLADSSGYGNPMSELSSGASTAEMGGLTGGRLTLVKNKTTKATIAAEGTPTYNGAGEGLALTIQLNDTAAVVCRCLIRRLRQAQVLVAFGCGVWLIILAKGDDFNLKSVAFVGGIYLCSKILLLVADHMQHDELRRSRED